MSLEGPDPTPRTLGEHLEELRTRLIRSLIALAAGTAAGLALNTCVHLCRSFAILGYSGGKAKALADVPIHFPVNDMQIAEDLQLVVGHMVMQWLFEHRPDKEPRNP